jgi:hypothetical protein
MEWRRLLLAAFLQDYRRNTGAKAVGSQVIDFAEIFRVLFE